MDNDCDNITITSDLDVQTMVKTVSRKKKSVYTGWRKDNEWYLGVRLKLLFKSTKQTLRIPLKNIKLKKK